MKSLIAFLLTMLGLSGCASLERAPLNIDETIQYGVVREASVVKSDVVLSRSRRAGFAAMSLNPIVFIAATSGVEKDFGNNTVNQYIVDVGADEMVTIHSYNIVQMYDCLQIRTAEENGQTAVIRVEKFRCMRK